MKIDGTATLSTPDTTQRTISTHATQFSQAILSRLTQADLAPEAQGSTDSVVARAQKRRSDFTRQADPTSQAQAVLSGASQPDPMGLQAATQQAAVTAQPHQPVQPPREAPTLAPDSESVPGSQTEPVEASSAQPHDSSAVSSPPASETHCGQDGVQPQSAHTSAAGQTASSALPGQVSPAEITPAADATAAPTVQPVSAASSSSGSAAQPRTGGIAATTALSALGKRATFKLQQTESKPSTNPDAFAAQAAKGLAAAIRKDGGRLTMRLTPDNLGLLSVKVQTNNGAVSARVEASESAARDLLAQHIDKLQSALEAHGVRVEGIDVVRMGDLQNPGGAGSGGHGASGTGQHMHQQTRSGAEPSASTSGRMDASEQQSDSMGFMEEPLGLYLHGVELRVDAVA